MWGYDRSIISKIDIFHPGVHMSPNDRVRIGTTVELHGPNYPAGVQTARSPDVRLEVSVTRDAHPAAKCGRTGAGGGGAGGGGGGPGGGGGGPHKQN